MGKLLPAAQTAQDRLKKAQILQADISRLEGYIAENGAKLVRMRAELAELQKDG